MKVLIFLLTSLVVSSGLPPKQREENIVDVGERKSITEINKANNLLHDDMLMLKDSQSSATTFEDSLWKSPVPYTLSGNLGLNAKGVVLRALDQFRLKSCIDFEPWDNKEEYYIKVVHSNGCWSYLGRTMNNGQEVSIGSGCDYISTAEHEFLHALGFYHEHNRYDRDDYVTINFTNIIQGGIGETIYYEMVLGMESNFQKVSREVSTTHDTQYDYWSVMHYGKYSFSNGNGITIIPKDPEYLDIIGHDFDMSPTDALELNLLYKCESSVAFMLHCDFSHDAACPITTCSYSSMSWEKVTEAPGGPSSDHTSLPSGNIPHAKDTSHFMHVSTEHGREGDSAWLETKRMTPKRACHVKCLQFYYFHSRSESDDLNIWIREFEDEQDFKGYRRLVETISGPQTKHWQIKYVPLSITRSFQVEFEVQKGALNSAGGISIDDINLSELECPHATLQINNFQEVLNNSNYGYTIYSPIYYSTSGYAYSFGVTLKKTFLGMFVQLVSGKYNDELDWPVPDHQVTLQIVDQHPNIQSHMSKEGSLTSNTYRLNVNGSYLWGNPEDDGYYYIDENNQTVYYGPKIGFRAFASLEEMQVKDFLKGGNAVFNIYFNDVRPLGFINELPCPLAAPVNITDDEHDKGPCFAKTTTQPPTTTDDKSIFCFAPSKISSPVLTLMALLMLLMH